MRKICVDVTVRLIIKADENAELSDIIDDLDYDFNSLDSRADVVDMWIFDYETIEICMWNMAKL